MRLEDLDYHLPESLIAARPADRRELARLLVVPAHASQPLSHRHVADLPRLLRSGDLLVINTTRVLPARFFARRDATAGRVEGLFIESRDDTTWHVMLRSGGTLRQAETLSLLADDPAQSALATLELIQHHNDGSWLVRKHSHLDTHTLLERVGMMPLPPYIARQRRLHQTDMDARQWDRAIDRDRYQTVYARDAGSVAAPTAGLHFTDNLLQRLQNAGVLVAPLTLHVGLGTFAPVRTPTLDAHTMHVERFSIPATTLHALAAARAEGRRIIPVGTTSVRALESLPQQFDTHRDYHAHTDLLIQPGFNFRYTDGLITNFHLPRSTLLALVAAKVGLERLMKIYQLAIAHRYRFFSYGDAMLITPPD